jgi:4-diphosphocytidyl-2-C-methyl-D-erythritol kinase
MKSRTRGVSRVRALAKINLDLRVLGKRPDGYHELRTIFQTISLADTLSIRFTPRRKTAIVVEDPLSIPDNLAEKAAAAALEAMGVGGLVEIRLGKRIPMGAGLGGGSSDAAAVLLTLPVLAGKVVPVPQLCRLAASLGSDVPFFLFGGKAAAVGRGAELFPLPDEPARSGVLVAPEIHISTAEAYRRLSPHLTSSLQENKMFIFQSLVWDRGVSGAAANDFESVVFEQEARLARLKRKLLRAGALPALMTGSGSALFGLFPSAAAARDALRSFKDERAFSISLISRARYRTMWWRALEEHVEPNTWPPRSRYAR